MPVNPHVKGDDVPVPDGGTGASDAGSARTNLGAGDLDASAHAVLDHTGIPGIGGGGALTLIEKKEITVATNDVTFAGLDGNADGIYVLESYIIPATGGGLAAYQLRPNGGATSSAGLITLGSGGYNHIVETEVRIGYSIVAAHISFGTTKIWARAAGPGPTGLNRHIRGEFNLGTEMFRTVGVWLDTSTNITSLVIHSGVLATEIGIGSTFILYKQDS